MAFDSTRNTRIWGRSRGWFRIWCVSEPSAEFVLGIPIHLSQCTPFVPICTGNSNLCWATLLFRVAGTLWWWAQLTRVGSHLNPTKTLSSLYPLAVGATPNNLLALTTFTKFTTFSHHLLRPFCFRNVMFQKRISKRRVLAVWVDVCGANTLGQPARAFGYQQNLVGYTQCTSDIRCTLCIPYQVLLVPECPGGLAQKIQWDFRRGGTR